MRGRKGQTPNMLDGSALRGFWKTLGIYLLSLLSHFAATGPAKKTSDFLLR